MIKNIISSIFTFFKLRRKEKKEVIVDPLKPTILIQMNGLSGIDAKMAMIHNRYGRYVGNKAAEMGLDVADIAAVIKVESGGKAFEKGKVIIRFENHIFYNKWGKRNKMKYYNHFDFNKTKKWSDHLFRQLETDEFIRFHGNQSREWEVFEFARGLDDTAAIKSISIGLAQIMGFSHKMVGYETPQKMLQKMTVSEEEQLNGMFNFILAKKICLTGLRTKNYKMFASGYNGPGQAEKYAKWIKEASTSYKNIANRSDI